MSRKKPPAIKEPEEIKIASITAFQFMQLNARCEALEITLAAVLMKKFGIPEEKTQKGLDQLAKKIFQAKLEKMEDKNPRVAAMISRWSNEDDLPEKYL